MKRITYLLILLFCLSSHYVLSQEAIKKRIELKHGSHRIGKRTDAEMQRWRNQGLGQFIHWGVYAIPGGQWNGKTSHYAAEWFRSSGLITKEEYDNLYKEFNPTDFDAEGWAKQAKQMGARYMIFTTKHHDGFCLWPSKYTDYTIANTPYKKDIVKQVVDAYTAQGIDVHLYFSIIDWNHKGYRSAIPTTAEEKSGYEEFKTFTRNQLMELLTDYPAIKGLWFDGSWDKAWINAAPWVDTLGMELRKTHPGLIIGSRFRADEFGNRRADANGDLIDDYDQQFERNLPNSLEETEGNDWEGIMTIPENQWGYHRDWSLTYVKTPYDLVEMMVKANSLNGNFVINFGPDGKGNIRSEETRIAKAVGDWMNINKDAVYDTYHSVLEKQDWGFSTQKGEEIYLTVCNKPMSNILKVKVPKSKNKDMIYVIEDALFLQTKKTAQVRNGGREKFGSIFYDIPIPQEMRTLDMPFVIKIRLKEVHKDERDSYMQAIT